MKWSLKKENKVVPLMEFFTAPEETFSTSAPQMNLDLQSVGDRRHSFLPRSVVHGNLGRAEKYGPVWSGSLALLLTLSYTPSSSMESNIKGKIQICQSSQHRQQS